METQVVDMAKVVDGVAGEGNAVSGPWVPPDLSPLPALDPRELPQRSPVDWSWLGRPVGLFLIGVLVIAVGSVIHFWPDVTGLIPCGPHPLVWLSAPALISDAGLIVIGLCWFCFFFALGNGFVAGSCATAICLGESLAIYWMMCLCAGVPIC
jgi:hypothetical protein